jgi:hypothetical protein
VHHDEWRALAVMVVCGVTLFLVILAVLQYAD